MCGPMLNWFSDLWSWFSLQKILDKISGIIGFEKFFKKKRYRQGNLLITGGLGFVGSNTVVEIF
jgi:hypothetical protein